MAGICDSDQMDYQQARVPNRRNDRDLRRGQVIIHGQLRPRGRAQSTRVDRAYAW